MSPSDALKTIVAMGLDPERLRADRRFVRWRETHRSYKVDGHTLYLHRGDHLADEDQLLLDWVMELRSPRAPTRQDQEGGEPISESDFLDIEGKLDE